MRIVYSPLARVNQRSTVDTGLTVLLKTTESTGFEPAVSALTGKHFPTESTRIPRKTEKTVLNGDHSNGLILLSESSNSSVDTPLTGECYGK